MFCKECGAEVLETSKFCRKCGAKLKQTDFSENLENKEVNNQLDETIDVIEKNDGDYVLFKNLKNRDKILKIISILEKGFEILMGILILIFIVEQFELDEGYKFSIYVLRFLVNFSGLMMIEGLIQLSSEILKIRKSQLKKGIDMRLYFGLRGVTYLLAFMAVSTFLNPSDFEIAKWVTLIGFGDISDLVAYFRVNIICLISAGILVYVTEEKLKISVDNNENN